VLDTQGIESCRPGFELCSTGTTKGDVVESDSKFIEHVAFKLMLVFVDCGTSPQTRPPLDNCFRRQPQQAASRGGARTTRCFVCDWKLSRRNGRKLETMLYEVADHLVSPESQVCGDGRLYVGSIPDTHLRIMSLSSTRDDEWTSRFGLRLRVFSVAVNE
jgi:hypothetical protein